MKTTIIYLLSFVSFLLFVNCSDKKKTTDTIKTETTSESKDSIVKTDELKALNEEIDAIPHHYICYTNNEKSSMQLSIAFDIEGTAKFVKYKGQKDSIPLQNVKEDFKNDGAYPTITQFYNEIHQGKVNGTYELTHSGNWDYAKYRREKDGEVFEFTINHELTIIGDGYRKTPCFGTVE